MDQPPPRRRLGCWGWIWIALGCLGLVLLLGLAWLHSTADLDAERERAIALGLPMTWEALGVAAKPGADPELVHRAVAILGRAKHCEGVDYFALDRPFCPVPPALTTWLAAGGSGVDADIDQVVEQLSGNPAVGIDTAAIARASAAGDSAMMCRLLLTWDQRSELGEHYLLRSIAGAEDPTRLLDLLTRLATSSQTTPLTGHYVSLRLSTIWILHVLRHRESLPAQACAGQARALSRCLDGTAAVCIACAPLSNDLTLRQPAEEVFNTLSLWVPRIMEMHHLSEDAFYRLGRARIAARAIDVAIWCQKHGVPTTCAAVESLVPHLPRLSNWDLPRALLSTMMDETGCLVRTPVAHMVLMEHLRITTYLRLLAADLDGSAWPVDPGDPAGGPLREIRRDGRLIGAYSVGPDGVDNGGDMHSDWCFALREELGQHRAADPPPAPTTTP